MYIHIYIYTTTCIYDAIVVITVLYINSSLSSCLKHFVYFNFETAKENLSFKFNVFKSTKINYMNVSFL